MQPQHVPSAVKEEENTMKTLLTVSVLLSCLCVLVASSNERQSEHDDDRDHHCWWKCDPFAARGLRHGRFRLLCYDSWAVRLRMPRNTPCASRTAAVTPDTGARSRLRTVRSSLLKEVSLISRCDHQQRRGFDGYLGTNARFNRYRS